MCLLAFHFFLLIVVIASRRNVNFQMFLFLLICKFWLPPSLVLFVYCVCGVDFFIFELVDLKLILGLLILRLENL